MVSFTDDNWSIAGANLSGCCLRKGSCRRSGAQACGRGGPGKLGTDQAGGASEEEKEAKVQVSLGTLKQGPADWGGVGRVR